ncbi:MAG: rhomboid family intramembrane serine protease [Vicinamibacteria bacterium]|nr:rhomboid family intramembrane serine protease [Vicinamibacteria bacterium]
MSAVLQREILGVPVKGWLFLLAITIGFLAIGAFGAYVLNRCRRAAARWWRSRRPPPAALASPQRLRDALLKELLCAGVEIRTGARIAKSDLCETRVVLPETRREVSLWLFDQDEPGALAALGERLAQFRREASAPSTFIVVGGDEKAREKIQATRRAVSSSRVTVMQLGCDGSVWLDRPALSLVATLPQENGALKRVAQQARKGELAALTESQRQILERPPDPEEDRALTRFRKSSAAVSLAVMAFLALVFVAQLWWGLGDPGLALPRMGALISEMVPTQPWRLLSAPLLHGSFTHLAGNVSILAFGVLLERLVGPARLLIVLVASALGGTVASTFGHPHGMSVGFSGANWGLMTATWTLARQGHGLLPDDVLAGLNKALRTTLLLNLGVSLLPGVDMAAHLGGGLVGAVLGWTLLSGRLVGKEREEGRPPSAKDRTVKIAATVAAVGVPLCLALAIVTGRPWGLRDGPGWRTVALAPTSWQIDVPETLAMTPGEAGGAGEWNYVFGDRRYDPASFTIGVEPWTGPTQGPEFLARLKAMLEATVTPGVQAKLEKVEELRTGTRTVAVSSWVINDVHVRVRHCVEGGEMLSLVGVEGADTPTSWKGTLERVFDSARRTGTH